MYCSSIQKSVSGSKSIGCNAIIESYKFGKRNFSKDKSMLTYYASTTNGALALSKSMVDHLPVHVFSKAGKAIGRTPQLYIYHGIFKVVDECVCNNNKVLSIMMQGMKFDTRWRKKKVIVYEFKLQLDGYKVDNN